jgi:RNA polymerase sigma factor (sigma-70 family)
VLVFRVVDASSDRAAQLVANHRAFLAFVEQRVGSRALAEDILQDAFVRGVERAEQVREEESLRAWFYRLLRNAVIDHRRHAGVADRRLESFARELEAGEVPSPDIEDIVCGCVARLTDELKPDHAHALRRIEVDGLSVKDYAAEVGITANNAGVRVFRARQALREQVMRSCGTCAVHGCIDCTCATAERGSGLTLP